MSKWRNSDGVGGGAQAGQPGQPGPGGALPLLAKSMWTWLLGGGGGCGGAPSSSLRGKRALVSGAGGGLGRELSLQLAREGCALICVDTNVALVQETLGLVQELQDPEDGPGPGLRGYACDWRNPGEALGLSRTVTTGQEGVDLIFIVPEGNNNNDSAVDSTGKIIGNEFWPLLGFLPGMLARTSGHVVHVLDEQIAHKTGLVADAWIESLHDVGANVRYTKVHLHADLERRRQLWGPDAAARVIVTAVRQGATEIRVAYPTC